MDREELLKELVKEKYGSILKFSKETKIPESSIRNIFTRGLDSVNAGTLVQICKKLNVDLESLMDGALSVRPNITKDIAWRNYVKSSHTCDSMTDEEFTRISSAISQLNEEGREKVVEYAEDLAAGGRYKKYDSANLGNQA